MYNATVIKAFESKRVMVLGDIMLDHYIWGKVERISPEAPVPVLDVKQEEYRLGGAANVALNLKALGAEVCLVGVCGADGTAELLKQKLLSNGIATDALVQDEQRRSTLKTRISSHSQQIVRVDYEDCFPVDELCTQSLISHIQRQLPDCDALIIEDYDKGVLSPQLIHTAVELAISMHIPIAVDPKKRHFLDYKRVSIFKPNYKEFEEGLGTRFKDVPSFLEAAGAFRQKQNIKHLVVTKGADGMYLFNDAGSLHFASIAKEVYDVSGAGDTVISVLTLAYISGLEISAATAWARNAASVVCGKLGTATVSQKELLDSLQDDKN